MEKTKVYVASPVRYILDTLKGMGFSQEKAMETVQKMALNGCSVVKKMGFVPISPILAFNGVYEEYSERERIDEACEALLLGCDYIYVVQTPYNDKSKGIARELELAQQHGISQLYVMAEG